MRDGFKVIDADAHFYEPADIWDKYMVDEDCYDQRPRVAQVHGRATLQYTDGQVAVGANRAAMSRMVEEKFPRGYNAWWSPESRLEDMDEQGWDIQVILATNSAVSAAYNRDPRVYAAMCRAHNNWAHDFCSVAPERLKFCAQVPGQLLDEMAVEMKRAVEEKGAVSIFLPRAIHEKMWHHQDYDKIWHTAVELQVPFAIHGIDSASRMPLFGSRYDGVEGGGRFGGGLMGFPFENMIALSHFMLSGILDRFPTLRLLVLESNAGWLPFFLNRLEKTTEGRQATVFKEEPLGASARDYFLRQCSIAADADEPTIHHVVEYLGNDNIVFNTDYPHFDAPPPDAPLRDIMTQPLSDESKEKILWDNSVKIYGERLVKDHPLSST